MEPRVSTLLIILTVSLIITGVNSTPSIFTSIFADDKKCKNNDDNNCNETKKKNQKASSKVHCEVDTEIKDHNKNTVVEPIDLQCNSNSQNLIDSNIQPRDDDGEGGFPPTAITLDPTSGPAGTVVNVFGSGFDLNGAPITVTFDGKVVATTTTDNNGNFSTDFKVFTPILGPQSVTAKALLSTASSIFTVTSGSPVIQLEPTSGPSGTLVNITGLNFSKNFGVNVLYDENIIISNVGTDGLGRFSTTFTVPGGVDGPHDVTAADLFDPNLDAGAQFTQTASGTTSTAGQEFLPF